MSQQKCCIQAEAHTETPSRIKSSESKTSATYVDEHLDTICCAAVNIAIDPTFRPDEKPTGFSAREDSINATEIVEELADAVSNSTSMNDGTNCILKATFTALNEKCCFSNQKVELVLSPGEVVWLYGPSGVGKTSIISSLLGLRKLPNVKAHIEWNQNINKSQRSGILFQNGVLIEGLTIEENIRMSMCAANQPDTVQAVHALLKQVGLDPQFDARKKPCELSGGMLRRACLAQILAQRKRVVVLDEPFVGLDPAVALEIVRLLCTLRDEQQLSYIIISHDHHLVNMIGVTRTVTLEKRTFSEASDTASNPTTTTKEFDSFDADARKSSSKRHLSSFVSTLSGGDARSRSGKQAPLWRRSIRGVHSLLKHGPSYPFRKDLFLSRLCLKLFDYVFYSAPLIFVAFFACGVSISTLLADLLTKIDPLALLASGKGDIGQLVRDMLSIDPSMAQEMIDESINPIKSHIFGVAVAYSFMLELGPLMTGLLLSGRIGGSYSGEIAMMQSTKQNDLLSTLGISPRMWSMLPSMVSALIAVPVLCWMGSWTAIWAATITAVKPVYGLYPDGASYWSVASNAVWTWGNPRLHWSVYPPLVCMYRSITYALIILFISEVCGRIRRELPTSKVPQVITWSVVLSGLTIILCDWGFNYILVSNSGQGFL